MRSPQTAKAAPSIQSCPDLPVHESTVCRDVRQRCTSVMTSVSQSLDLARPTESSTPAACRLRLQAGNELGHDL